MRRPLRRFVAVTISTFALLATTGGARAQARPPGPLPTLSKEADPNDWQAYFEYGVERIRRTPSESDIAFYWASRLDPTRAEPLYARWVCFWLLNISEWPDYLADNGRVLAEPKVIASDSLRYRAYLRNPFVSQGLVLLLFEEDGAVYTNTPFSRGFFEYANERYPEALKAFNTALERDPGHFWVRYDLALVYTAMKRFDSAAAQLERLSEAVKNEERTRLSPIYESRAMLEYALGMLYTAMGRMDAARDAFGRSLQEDLAFAPARKGLGRLAEARQDFVDAVTQFGFAVEVAPGDAVARYWYAQALVAAERYPDAIAQLKKAIELEPYYADPYRLLGAAFDSQSDTTNALREYEEYLRRAPRSDVEGATPVKTRIRELTGRSP